ncbi:MAG: RCC1 domain-containing protein, partial [Ilumatobacteraceae bacterium]
MRRRFLLPFLALLAALWMLAEPTANALTERTLTINPTSYEANGYEASTKSIVITYTISEAQSSGSLTFSSANTDVCTIAQTINSGRYSRTEATVTFVRGGSCTLTITVGAWSTYTGAAGSITFPITDPGSAVVWGSSIASPVSYGGVLKDLTVTDIDTGGLGMSRTTCAIADGRAYCWGDNGSGQLGINSTSDSNQPVAVHTVGDGTGSALPDDAEIRTISVSVSGHVCVTAMPAGGTTDGDMRAYCWGRNTYGQLGDGTQINRTVPVEVDDCDCGATLISAGYDHTCAVIGGHAACWGYGTKGQIGDGLTIDSSVPAYVAETGDGDRGGATSALPTGAEITAIEAGGDASCAVADGRAYCWGHNANGRLGDGTTTNRLVPVAVDVTTGLSGRTVTDIALGGRHSMGGSHSGSWMFTCAVASGDAYCWGSDGWDAIGNGGEGGGYKPIAVYTSSQGSALPDDAEVTAIDAGWRHACAVAEGIAYCWGADTDKPGVANVNAGSALRGNHITKISVTGSQSGTSHMTTNAAVRQFVRADQTITFPTPTQVSHTTASVDLTDEATASSGLDVILSAGPDDVCTIAGEVVTVVSHGSCTITANQPGDGDWAPAPSVVRVLSISAPTATTSSTTTSTSTTSSTTTTIASSTTSSTSTTTTPTSSSTSSTAPEVPSTTTQPEPSTTSTTIEDATTASVSGPLLVAEGTDGSVAIAVAVDARNRVVSPEVDGTFRLPGGASLDIVAGP